MGDSWSEGLAQTPLGMEGAEGLAVGRQRGWVEERREQQAE